MRTRIIAACATAAAGLLTALAGVPATVASAAGRTISGVEADLSHAQAEGAGYFYERTDTSYATPPAFFAQEVSAVAGT